MIDLKPIIKSERCKDCENEHYRNIMYPCSECKRNEEMEDKYKRKEQVN